MTSVDEEFEKSYLETANSKYNIFSIGKSKVNGDSHIPAHVQMVLDETEKIIEKADFKDSRIENVSVDWKGTIMVGGPDRLRLACLNYMFARIESIGEGFPEDLDKMKIRVEQVAVDFCLLMWNLGKKSANREAYYEFAYSSVSEMCGKIQFQPSKNLEFYVNKFMWMAKAADTISHLLGDRTRYVPTKPNKHDDKEIVSFLKTGQMKHAIFAAIEPRQITFRFLYTNVGSGQSGNVSAQTTFKMSLTTVVRITDNGEINWVDIKRSAGDSIKQAFGGLPNAERYALNIGTVMASMWMTRRCGNNKTYLQRKGKIGVLDQRAFVGVEDSVGNSASVEEIPDDVAEGSGSNGSGGGDVIRA
jgi:hypothetical protein